LALPEDIIVKVRQDFSEDDSLRVLQKLSDLQKENSELFSIRILRCVVVFMCGEVSRISDAIALARLDWRDLIVAAEYDGGRRIRLLELPFDSHPKIEVFKQWLIGQQIKIPWRVGNSDEKWKIKSSEIRELSLNNVNQMKNVEGINPPISDPSLFYASLNLLCIRGSKEISASEAFEAKVFIIYQPQLETKDFEFKKFGYRPQDVTKRGQW
jgi:hypothetical protein